MTIFDYINKHSQMYADKVAISNITCSITYQQLYKAIASCQKLFFEEKVYVDRNVVLKYDDPIKFTILFFSLIATRCWVIPVSSNITDYELNNLREKADFIIFDKCISIDELKNGNSEFLPQKNYFGIYHLTSGTTGLPKLAVRLISNLVCEGLSYIKTYKYGPNDRIFSCCPIHHSFALGAALMASIICGSTLYLSGKFLPRQVINVIKSQKISILIAVPTMLKLICKVNSDYNKEEGTLKTVIIGAGCVDEILFKEFKSKFGIYTMSNYGSTETGGVLARTDYEEFPSVGKPMEGVRIKICDDNNRVVPTGKIGELYVKSDFMMSGYAGEGTRLDSEGFISMGDYAYLDANGNVFLKGRKKFLISIGENKINSFEIERIIEKYPGIEECVVAESYIGNRKILKAFIVGKVNKSKLCKFCSKNLRYVPSEFEIVNSIPRNEMGKVRYDVLCRQGGAV